MVQCDNKEPLVTPQPIMSSAVVTCLAKHTYIWLYRNRCIRLYPAMEQYEQYSARSPQQPRHIPTCTNHPFLLSLHFTFCLTSNRARSSTTINYRQPGGLADLPVPLHSASVICTCLTAVVIHCTPTRYSSTADRYSTSYISQQPPSRACSLLFAPVQTSSNWSNHRTKSPLCLSGWRQHTAIRYTGHKIARDFRHYFLADALFLNGDLPIRGSHLRRWHYVAHMHRSPPSLLPNNAISVTNTRNRLTLELATFPHWEDSDAVPSISLRNNKRPLRR